MGSQKTTDPVRPTTLDDVTTNPDSSSTTAESASALPVTTAPSKKRKLSSVEQTSELKEFVKKASLKSLKSSSVPASKAAILAQCVAAVIRERLNRRRNHNVRQPKNEDEKRAREKLAAYGVPTRMVSGGSVVIDTPLKRRKTSTASAFNSSAAAFPPPVADRAISSQADMNQMWKILRELYKHYLDQRDFHELKCPTSAPTLTRSEAIPPMHTLVDDCDDDLDDDECFDDEEVDEDDEDVEDDEDWLSLGEMAANDWLTTDDLDDLLHFHLALEDPSLARRGGCKGVWVPTRGLLRSALMQMNLGQRWFVDTLHTLPFGTLVKIFELPDSVLTKKVDTKNVSEKAAPKKSKKPRCFQCNKKVGLCAIQCKCSHVFCDKHRYAEAHSCTFDFKSSHKAALAQSNPKTSASTLSSRV